MRVDFDSPQKKIQKLVSTLRKSRTELYFKGEFNPSKPIKNNSFNMLQLAQVQKWVRGFQRRNWYSLKNHMLTNNFDKEFINAIYTSWIRFKVMSAIRPMHKQFFVWIFKNYLLPEQQQRFEYIRDICIEEDSSFRHEFERQMNADYSDKRIIEYFINEDMDYWIPISLFPLVEINGKERMFYAFKPYEVKQDDLKWLRERIITYIYDLQISELFVPPADVLFKVGNQLYNDEGVCRKDYERPQTSFDSSFKYQRFLAQPLKPREVWLPGKAIKNNNVFWMNICRQIIKNDPTYPSADIEELHNRVREHLADVLRFDISGFGFQFLREYLDIGISCIQELYPCSDIDEQADITRSIFDRIKVQLEDGSFVYPTRGIGLGYYEDLKTLVMLAILHDYNPVSVYGDQGLISQNNLDGIIKLGEMNFELKFEKIEVCGTRKVVQVKWAGVRMKPDSYKKPKQFLDPLMGAFFSRHHWERKLGLLGVCREYPKHYRKLERKIAFMYELIFGYEFQRGDTFNNFKNCGVLDSVPIQDGYGKLYRVESKLAPYSANLFDITYQTPFRISSQKAYPNRVSKDFQIERKKIYRSTEYMDNVCYLYLNPRISYNKKDKVFPRVLPEWADFLYLANHGKTSGSLTYGLESEDIMLAPIRQVFSQNPIRARAEGGYSIDTIWRSSRGASEEWVYASQFLVEASGRSLPYVRRNDLDQHPHMMNDPMYYNDNLISYIISEDVSKKRKRSIVSHVSANSDYIQARILETLPYKIGKGAIDNLAGLVSLVNKEIEMVERVGSQHSVDLHGEIESDEEYYAEDIDLGFYD